MLTAPAGRELARSVALAVECRTVAVAQASMAEPDYVCVVLDERGGAQPVASCVSRNGVGSAATDGRQAVQQRHEFLVACRPKESSEGIVQRNRHVNRPAKIQAPGDSWRAWWVGVEELLEWAEEDKVMDAAWKAFLHNEVTDEAAAANVTVQVWMQRNVQAQEAAKAEVLRQVADEDLLLLKKTRDHSVQWSCGNDFRFVNWAVYASPSKPWNASIYSTLTKKQVSHGYFATPWEAALRVARVLGPKSRELDAREQLLAQRRSAKEETAKLPTTTAQQQQGGAIGVRSFTFEVVVPEGCFSRQEIQVQAPYGMTIPRRARGSALSVTIPEGVGPGQRFQVRTPATTRAFDPLSIAGVRRTLARYPMLQQWAVEPSRRVPPDLRKWSAQQGEPNVASDRWASLGRSRLLVRAISKGQEPQRRREVEHAEQAALDVDAEARLCRWLAHRSNATDPALDRCYARQLLKQKRSAAEGAGNDAEEADGLQLHLSKVSSSGYKGVVECKGSNGISFRAQTTALPVRLLGTFDSALDAAKCYARHLLKQRSGLAVEGARGDAEEEEGEEEEQEGEKDEGKEGEEEEGEEEQRLTEGEQRLRDATPPPVTPSHVAVFCSIDGRTVGTAAGALQVGARVSIEWSSGWENGTVAEVLVDKKFVHTYTIEYDDGERHNEDLRKESGRLLGRRQTDEDAQTRPSAKPPPKRQRLASSSGGILSTRLEDKEVTSLGLPGGWEVRIGGNANRTYKIYCSPCGSQFRSRVEVARFLSESSSPESVQTAPDWATLAPNLPHAGLLHVDECSTWLQVPTFPAVGLPM